MVKRTNTTIILYSLAALIFAGGLYFVYSFVRGLAPQEITITRNAISTNRDFINGVSIEIISVDSIGKEGYPVKYTTIYTASCSIHHPENKPPEPPDIIELYKPGKYSWYEDTVKVKWVHDGLQRKPLTTNGKLSRLNKFGNYPVCPIKFEQGQWYFLTFGDPQVTGIFFYIDKSGKEHQYFLESGVSPV